jgi:hypothetical protein
MCIHTILNGHIDITDMFYLKKKLFSFFYKAFETVCFFFLIYICQHRFTLQFAMSKFNQVIRQKF